VPVALVAAVVGAYLLWLGWNTPYVEVGGSTTGPYTSGEVCGLVVTIAVLTVVTVWRDRRARLVVNVVVSTLTLVLVFDDATRPRDDASFLLLSIVMLGGPLWSACYLAASRTDERRSPDAAPPDVHHDDVGHEDAIAAWRKVRSRYGDVGS
jgi:hypothetical protein